MESFREYSVRKDIKRYYEIGKQINKRDAYLIGYLAGDGAYITNGGFPFLSVVSIDLSQINFVKKYYVPDATVISLGKRSSFKVKAINDAFEIRFPGIASKQFSRFGIFCKKENRRVVGIPREFLYAYIAGIIDADGFITVTKRNDCRTPRLRWFITHRSEIYLSDLQNWLEGIVPTTLRQHGDNCWRLQAQNTEINKVFLNRVLPNILISKKYNVLSKYLEKYLN